LVSVRVALKRRGTEVAAISKLQFSSDLDDNQGLFLKSLFNTNAEMSPAGPSVPPHLLAKRKRSTDDASGSDSDQPPNLPRPPSRSTSPENGDKRRRVIGPSLPPAPLDERPVKVPVGLDSNQDDGESSDDDGLGPALPPGPGESVCLFL
jgi:hypothetical protein